MSDASGAAGAGETVARDTAPRRVPKIATLLRDLDRAGIRYCHWKSNWRIREALAGEGDLDLLVERGDFAAFVAILLRHGFKEAENSTSRRQPAVFHFLGNDDTWEGLIHVHAYARVLTGDHLLKTWALPLERLLLEDTRREHGICLPSKAAELVVFVFRNMIKHTTLLDIYLGRRSRQEVLEEYRWLVSDVCMEDCYRKLAVHFPMISPAQFRAALELIGPKGAVMPRIRMGFRFQRALAKYGRYGRARQTAWTAASLCRTAVRMLFGKREKKTLRTGGAIIALAGMPPADRAALAERIRRWLGRHLCVRVIQAGQSDRAPAQMLAHRTNRLLRRAYRDSRNGQIIVCDLYPPEHPGTAGWPPVQPGTVAAPASGLGPRESRSEAAAYHNVCPPDLVLDTRESEDTAAGPEQTPEDQPARHAEDASTSHTLPGKPHLQGCSVIPIAMDPDLERAFSEVRRTIWAHL